MPVVPAKIIPEPKNGTRSVIVPAPNVLPVFDGKTGNTSYRCGNCKAILVNRISHGQLRNLVIKCPKCSSYNEIP